MNTDLIKDQFKKISKKTKIEIIRFLMSFIMAWGISIILNDFPYFVKLIQNTSFDIKLQNLLVTGTEWILNLFSYDTYSQGKFLQIIHTPGVRLEYGCLGIRHLIIFTVFIITHIGHLWIKAIYLIVGIVLIITVNIIRATLIAISQTFTLETELVHDISTPILMYFTILFLWIFWANKYGKYIETIKN